VEKIQPYNEKEVLVTKIHSDLMALFGPVIGGEDLYKVLGYKTGAAFRLALKQGDIDLSIFKIDKRRGKFALTVDIVTWLINQKYKSLQEE
jgi:hypothetical protein